MADFEKIFTASVTLTLKQQQQQQQQQQESGYNTSTLY